MGDLVRITAERDHLQAIFDAPRVMMFADGREATTNERHLCNLMEWARKDQLRAKEELQHFREQWEKSHAASEVEIAALRKQIEGHCE